MTTKVVLLTPFHVVGGEIIMKDQRLSDILNDRSLSVVQLNNATFARISEPGNIVGCNPGAMIPKDQVVVAFEEPGTGQSTAKRLYSFVKKDPHKVTLLLDGIEVEGLIHKQGQLDLVDLHRLLSTSKDSFMPITQAVVTFSADTRHVIRTDSLIVNVRRIHYLAKSEMSIEATVN